MAISLQLDGIGLISGNVGIVNSLQLIKKCDVYVSVTQFMSLIDIDFSIFLHKLAHLSDLNFNNTSIKTRFWFIDRGFVN